MEKPFLTQEGNFRMVGRTTSLEEANQLSEQYEFQGFTTKIVKKKQGEIALYEVWVGRKPDILQGTR
jgi:tRNA1(Val) A37 N6-methylase TrmN6